MKSKLMYCILAILIIGIISWASADTVSLEPTDDMYTDPNGTEVTSQLWVANWPGCGGHFERIMLNFDLSELTGQTIDSATLNLYKFFTAPDGSSTPTNFYAITQPWDEDTWNHTQHIQYNSTVWASQVFTSQLGWYEIDITNLVQAWVDDSITNYGLVIIANSGYKFSKFRSKEYSNPNNRPYLEVSYTPTIMYGDVNGDEDVSAYDAALTLQYSAGLITDWENWQLLAADVDGDESITSYDAALILQYSAGLIDHFPVEEGGKIANFVDAKVRIEKASNEIHICTSNLTGQNVIAFQFDLYHNGEFVSYELGKISKNGQIAVNEKDGLLKISYMNKYPLEGSGEIISLEFVNPVQYELKNFLMNTTKINPNSDNDLKSEQFILGNNYPNPVKTSTTFSYSISENLNQDVKIEIFNILGQLVVAVKGENGKAVWTPKDIPNGIYFYKLEVGEFSQTKKMILMR